MNLKKGEEDYLRVIFKLDNNEGIRNIDIAEELKISKASVSEMLKKLAEKKLVKIKLYSKVYLTEKGEDLASNIYKKHRISKIFMQKVLNFNIEESEEHAHNLEHSFSLEAIEKLEKFMNAKPISNPSYVG